MSHDHFPEPLNRIVDDLLPLIRQLFSGKYAVAVAGSYGKKRNDGMSDIDLRAYYENWIPDTDRLTTLRQTIDLHIKDWRRQGIEIDGYWPRRISEIDDRLQSILDGSSPDPDPCIWTIWGYHLPTDLANNTIIEDPFAIISTWQRQLQTYPDKLRNHMIKKHLDSALYWRHDYHYQNKVARQDTLFCAGLASLLAHNLVQVIFALNRVYYSGDGWNLNYIARFHLVPPGFCSELESVLLVGDPEQYPKQRERLCRLIDSVEHLVKSNL